MHWYQWTLFVLIIRNSAETGPEIIEYEAGTDLMSPLYCHVENIQQAKWEKAGTTLTFGKTVFDTRMSIVSKGRDVYHLKITKMTLSDKGIYKCSDGSGKEIRSYTLKVKVRATIGEGKYSGPTVHSNEGETVQLWCNATGYPKPEISWYTIERTSSEQEKWTYLGIDGSMLGIHNVSRECATKFQCQAINSYRMDKPVTRNITFIVKFSPEISVINKVHGRYNTNNGILKGKPGEKVELICYIYASPLANVSWLRNDTLIGEYIGVTKSEFTNRYSYTVTPKYDESKKYTLVSLEFTLDTDDTFTSYHCQAENDIGSNRKTIFIKRNTKS